MFLGPPGTGKTHLAIGIAIRACQAGHRVAFATGAGWIGSQATGIDRSPQAAQKIEMTAVLEIAALFPRDQPLVIWSDNLSVVDCVRDAMAAKLRKPAWMPQEFAGKLGGILSTRPPWTVRWAPRRSTPLLARADRLAYRAARPPST